MNDFNFDKMKSFNTPDEWAEKAREIPQKYKKPTPFLFFPDSRSFAAVASLVLVCCLSVLFFIIKPDDNILPVDPSATMSSETENLEPTDPTYEKRNPQKPDEYVNTEPTENQQSTENSTTESPTQKPTSSTEQTDSTQKPTDSRPTTKPTEKPTNSQQPTAKPTQKPTQEPTSKPTQKPTEGVVGNPDPVICFGSYSLINSWEVNSVDVFCKLYDNNGNLVGDKDLYSYQHEALVYSITTTTAYVSYEPASKGLLLKSGQYSYYFYDYYGKILSQGYVLVS